MMNAWFLPHRPIPDDGWQHPGDGIRIGLILALSVLCWGGVIELGILVYRWL